MDKKHNDETQSPEAAGKAHGGAEAGQSSFGAGGGQPGEGAATGTQSDFGSDTSGIDELVQPVDPIGPKQPGLNLDEYESMAQFLSGDADYAALPHPDVFNAYPAEVQRKIMEWTDRDVKARRDDESRRQDELTRSRVERERRSQSFPTVIVVVAILCGAVTGIVTQNPVFTLAFILVPIAVIVARLVGDELWGGKRRDPNDHKLPPRVQ